MSRKNLKSEKMQSNRNSIALSNRKHVVYRSEFRTEQQLSEMQCTKISFKKDITFSRQGEKTTSTMSKYKPCALTATCKGISVRKKSTTRNCQFYS